MEQYFDPYKNFRFRVIWDGKPVAGVSRVGALKRSTEVVRHSEGGDAIHASRKSPGKTEYESVTLERGLTSDRDFAKWASAVSSYSRSGPDKDFRKDVRLEVYDEWGTRCSPIGCFAAGSRNTRRCQSWMLHRMPSRSKRSSSSWRRGRSSRTKTAT
jgi:phage tail-like protein